MPFLLKATFGLRESVYCRRRRTVDVPRPNEPRFCPLAPLGLEWTPSPRGDQSRVRTIVKRGRVKTAHPAN